MSDRPARAIDPLVAQRVAMLGFTARRAVDGLLAGIHRSPHRGASVVFVEHREYRPGDDLRLLDWRAYARTDRHSIKRFEQETQLRATLVLDTSASMDFGGERGARKLDHAAILLAALAHVLIRQGDATGVTTFDEAVRAHLPARSRPAHLDAIMTHLAEEPTPRSSSGGGSTKIGRALLDVAEHAGKRGLVAVASDLLDFDEGALSPIHQLVARGHDVLVFHVLHPDEINLPFDSPARFYDPESEATLDADPEALRAAYAAELGAFLADREHQVTDAGARYHLCSTDGAPDAQLGKALAATRRRGWG